MSASAGLFAVALVEMAVLGISQAAAIRLDIATVLGVGWSSLRPASRC